MDPLVSVLIAARNGAALLPQTLDSVRDQTLSDWECVIVDDASDDATPAVAQRYAEADDRFRLIRRSVSDGPYGAANTGLVHSRGVYIARLDADDVAEPNRLEAQTSFLEHNPDLRACASWWRRLHPDGRLDARISRFPVESPAAIKWAICVVAGLAHSTLCIRRDAIDAIGGYAVLPAAADYGLWCELARRHWLGVVPQSLVVWREHEAQMSAQRLDLQRSLSIDLLAAHLKGLGARGWDAEAIEVLWRSGRWQRVDLSVAFDVLRRWEDLWRADRSLTREDRRILSMLTHRIRVRVVKWNHERRVVTVARETLRWIGHRRPRR